MRLAGFCALVSVALFVFWHSGARAGALCERERFVSSGSLSLWPPGARCTFGEPALHDTLLNPWFLATVIAVGAIAVLADALRRPRHTIP